MHHRQILTYAGQEFVQTHYTEWGDAENPELVFCIHGLTRNSRDFDELAHALSDRFRVVCMDVAGRGLSGHLQNPLQYNYPAYISQAACLLAHLNPQRLHWVGTSMGGILGMLLAAAPNTPISRMVISDVGPVIPKEALKAIAEYVGKAPEFDSLDQVEQYLRQVYAGFGALSEQQWRHLAEHSSRRDGGRWHLGYDPAIATAFGEVTEDVDLRPVWEQVRCPVLVLRGADSGLLTADIARAMAQKPRVTVVEYAGVGHAPMMMSTDQIGAVKGFLTDKP